jgi:teichuronic acid biosynthesis protein TuaF
MSLLENESVSRILTRFKKLFFILLLLPLLLAGLGYFIEMNQETTSKATAEIMLGEYPIPKYNYTDAGTVQELLKRESFLNELKDEYKTSYDSKELADKTNPTMKPGKIIEISYTADSKAQAEEVLNELVKALNKDINQYYKNKKNELEEDIQNAEKSASADDVLELEALNTLQSEYEKLRPAKILKDVTVDEGSNNPIRRAILGFLIGIMFSISILLAPEVFRK